MIGRAETIDAAPMMLKIAPMRALLVFLFAIAFAAASVAAAGISPMGTAAHASEMAAHQGQHEHHHGAPAGAECPAPLIACSGVGSAPEAVRAARRFARVAERSPESPPAIATHEPALSTPPPKA